MAFGFKRSTSADDRLETIEATIQRMLDDDRIVFDLAMSTLLDGVEWKGVKREIKATDQRVNDGEREIRRDLVVHASVVGAIDTPAILVYMSIVKDIERIGDYGKNLRDLARDGADLSAFPAWHETRAEVSQMIADTAEAFATRDAEQARHLLARGDELLAAPGQEEPGLLGVTGGESLGGVGDHLRDLGAGLVPGGERGQVGAVTGEVAQVLAVVADALDVLDDGHVDQDRRRVDGADHRCVDDEVTADLAFAVVDPLVGRLDLALDTLPLHPVEQGGHGQVEDDSVVVQHALD